MSDNLHQREENRSFHFPFLCLYICPLSLLCGMLSAASPRQSNKGHFCSRQGHCCRGTLHGKFGCLSCTSNHSAFEGSTSANPRLSYTKNQQLSWDSEYGGWVPRKGTDTASPMQPSPPRARTSAGTMALGSCMECCPCTQHGQQSRREQPITKVGDTRIYGYGEGEWTSTAQHSSLPAFLVLSVIQISILQCPP